MLLAITNTIRFIMRKVIGLCLCCCQRLYLLNRTEIVIMVIMMMKWSKQGMTIKEKDSLERKLQWSHNNVMSNCLAEGSSDGWC